MTISMPMTTTSLFPKVIVPLSSSALLHTLDIAGARPPARKVTPSEVDISVLDGQQFCSVLPLDRSSGDFPSASRSSGFGRLLVQGNGNDR
jgi:hypothetical protein